MRIRKGGEAFYAVDMETVYLDSLGVFLYPAEDSIPTVGRYCGLVMLQFSITLKQKRLFILFECGLCRQNTGAVQHLKS